MKNKIIIASVLLLCTLLCSCREGNNKAPADTTAPHPENGVHYEYGEGTHSNRVLSSTTYEGGVAVHKNEYEYWDNGKLKSITSKTGDEVNDVWSYSYHENGILSQMVRQYTEAGSDCRDDYRYNDDGNISFVGWYTDDEFVGGQRYTYNKKGDTTLEEQLDANEDVITYTQYSFDKSGNTKKSEQFMYGSLVGYGEYSYEDKKLSGIKYYDTEGKLTREIQNEYDGKGNIVKVKNLDGDGNLMGYTESLYDDEGFNYKDIIYQDGKPLYAYEYTKDGARIYSAYN